jgi:voltage-gated potassium channel
MAILWRRAALMLLLLGTTIGIGASGYMLVDGYPLLDAVYMAAITMTTVGYGEVIKLSHAGRMFNVAYVLFSVGMLLLTMGVMTHTVIALEFGNLIDRRRQRKMIDSLSNHFIVCGFGRVGRGAAAELRNSGQPLVVVDKNEMKSEWAIRDGYLSVHADATHDDVLRLLHIERARGLIAALTTDADNLFVVISARTLNSKVRIAARCAADEAERKLRQVGADAVLAPYTTTGIRLAQALMRPHVQQFLDFATSSDISLRIEQLQVSEASSLAGRTLGHARLRSELNVHVLAIRRASGAMVPNPAAETLIEAGDYLIAMGEEDPLRRLEERAEGDAG